MSTPSDILKKIAHWIKPSPRLIEWAKRLARHAHDDWVVFFFFGAYFMDSFLIFLPADALISCTLLLAPYRQRAWVLAAAAGSLTGFAVFYFLSLSSFQPWVIEIIHQNDFSSQFDQIIRSASTYGYANLVMAVLTVVPPVPCLIAGIIIGLNPFLVLLIVFGAKVFRVFLMIYLMRYVKVSVVGIKRRMDRRRDARIAAEEKGVT